MVFGELLMSKIDKLIQELQLKKKKIDYLTYIKELLTGDQHCVDFVEVQEEVLGKLTPLIDKLSESIESDVEMNTETLFSKETVETLKLLAEKVKQRKEAPPAPADPMTKVDNPQPQKKPAVAHQDKLAFAIDNRHLSAKNVRVLNDRNMDVTGTVVGLDAPHVIVKTSQGPTIQVPLDKIELV